MSNVLASLPPSLQAYLTTRYTAATARAYAYEIDRYWARVGGEEVARGATYADLVAELTALRKRYPTSPATVERTLAGIKCYYRYLYETERRADLPGANLRLRDNRKRRRQGAGAGTDQQLQDLLTDEELQLLLQPRRERYPALAQRNAVVVGLLVHQALTVGELVRLTTDDIDLPAGRLQVRHNGRRRGRNRRGRGRTLALVASQVMQLHAYLHEGRPGLIRSAVDPGRALLLTGRGTPERGEGIHYLIQTLRPLVPTKRLTPTLIRQSVLAGKLRAGEDLRNVQAFAGHGWISTTEGYRETDLEELRRAVERSHPLGGDTEQPKD
jgi:integrase/recombinase XerD